MRSGGRVSSVTSGIAPPNRWESIGGEDYCEARSGQGHAVTDAMATRRIAAHLAEISYVRKYYSESGDETVVQEERGLGRLLDTQLRTDGR